MAERNHNVVPLNAAECLRTPESVYQPDPRMDPGKGLIADALQQRHAIIDRLRLPDAVPESVRIHFETAKNAWLYAWFVYRFHMVAEQYVLTTLEFALRTRLESLGIVSADVERKPGLSVLLKAAQAQGLITNAQFCLSKRRALSRARQRKEMEVIREMASSDAQERVWEFSEGDVRAEDWVDWLSHFIHALPQKRNHHTHGTPMLYPTVLGTFEIIHDLICQLWAATPHQTS